MTIPPKPRIFLQLLASALFAIGLVPAIAAAQTTYTNSARIILPNSVVASTYPSTITVSGATRPIAKVTVTLNRVNQRPNDLEVLLVGPTGVKVSLMQDSGGNGQANNQVWTFDDAATGMMPGSAATGTYKPSFDSGIALTVLPAPALPYSVQLSDFIGTSANGTWSLYIYDSDGRGSGGDLQSGWALNITYASPTAGEVALSGRAITASGMGIRGALVRIEGGDIEPTTTVTSMFGRFTFKNLTAGQTYIVTISAKRYAFTQPVRVVGLDDNLEGFDFVASP